MLQVFGQNTCGHDTEVRDKATIVSFRKARQGFWVLTYLKIVFLFTLWKNSIIKTSVSIVQFINCNTLKLRIHTSIFDIGTHVMAVM